MSIPAVPMAFSSSLNAWSAPSLPMTAALRTSSSIFMSFTADASAVNDMKLDEAVRNAAVIGKDGADHAFKLLENAMGTAGIDILYDIAWGQSGTGYPAAAQRAQRQLTKSDGRGRASPKLLVSMDLRAASSCDAKRALMQRARE